MRRGDSVRYAVAPTFDVVTWFEACCMQDSNIDNARDSEYFTGPCTEVTWTKGLNRGPQPVQCVCAAVQDRWGGQVGWTGGLVRALDSLDRVSDRLKMHGREENVALFLYLCILTGGIHG